MLSVFRDNTGAKIYINIFGLWSIVFFLIYTSEPVRKILKATPRSVRMKQPCLIKTVIDR